MTSLHLGPARLPVTDDHEANRLLLARSLELQLQCHGIAAPVEVYAAT